MTLAWKNFLFFKPYEDSGLLCKTDQILKRYTDPRKHEVEDFYMNLARFALEGTE